jgi:hypothetical protein
MKNIGDREVVVSGKWRVGSEDWRELGTIILLDKVTKVIETNYQLLVTNYQLPTTTITLVLIGDVNIVIMRHVEFGELVDLAVRPDSVYPVGYLEVPFEVVNRGKVGSEFIATFTIFTAKTQSKMSNAKCQMPNQCQMPNDKPQITQIAQIVTNKMLKHELLSNLVSSGNGQ